MMSCDVVLGGQWGDEGKAKIIDAICKNYQVVSRYQGGANAGHTVYNAENKKYVFHLFPSGILNDNTICVIANGAVLEIEAFLEEATLLRKNKIRFENKIKISSQCFLVLPFHKILDEAKEKKRKKQFFIGTTKKGIGPAYIDKYSRIGIRVSDLKYPNQLKEKLEENVKEKNIMLKHYHNEKEIDIKPIFNTLIKQYELIKPFVIESPFYFNQILKEGKKILLEGAQGSGLDIDFGTYPYVTSSSPTSAGACTGTGIGVKKINEIIGVFKAYITRVGQGPLPTKLPEDRIEQLRKYGCEFGATTGRARECGWFDTIQAKYSIIINNITSIALTKLDVLDHYEVIKVCTHYLLGEKKIENFPLNTNLLKKVKPVYEELPGWQEKTSHIKDFDALPKNAKNYILCIEKHLDCPIKFISNGPNRLSLIYR